MRIIDAWMQHPSARFLADPMFDSLRRWGHGQPAAAEIPVEATIAAMDARMSESGCCAPGGGPRAR
jgi:hypothetical protein